MRSLTTLTGGLLLALATPAFAQDATTTAKDPAAPVASADTPPAAPAFKLSGGATLISDYRFRGLTQSDKGPAVQGTLNLNHKSGFYIGTWISEIDGSGNTPLLNGYGGAEVDLYGGFTKTFHGVGVDVGLLYYYYPGGATGLNTDFFEPYASASYTIGPVAAKVGLNYAWGGQKGLQFGQTTGDDNLYVYLEGSIGIPKTPITLKGHVGRTKGALGLANANQNDDEYEDFSGTAEAVGGPFKVGVTYVDTTITDQYFGAPIYRFDQHFGRGHSFIGYIGVSF